MKTLPLLSLLVVTAILATFNARAHSVWIEPTPDGGLALRFAEPDGKLETSPGHLDELSAVTAFSVVSPGAPSPLEVAKKRDHFHLIEASANHPTGAEATYQVMGSPGRPGRKPVVYARWHPQGSPAPTPSLNLDIVPTGQPGEARAWLRGKPLAGAAAILRLPDEREREIVADAEGVFRFTTDQKGLHQIRIARHRETLPGFHQGREHELTSHNASLTWIEP